MIANSNKLSPEELEMMNRSLLVVIPELSNLPFVSTRTVKSKMKMLRDVRENALNTPLGSNTTASDDVELPLSANGSSALPLSTVPVTLLSAPSVVSCSSLDDLYSNRTRLMGMASYSSYLDPGCKASVISDSNTGTKVGIISNCNHEKEYKTMQSEMNEEHSTGQKQSHCLQLCSSCEGSMQNYIQFQEKGTEQKHAQKWKIVDEGFINDQLESNKRDIWSLVSSGFDRCVSNSDILNLFSVVDCQTADSPLIQSRVYIKRTDLLLSPVPHLENPDSMPRMILTKDDLPPNLSQEKQSTSEEIQSSLMTQNGLNAKTAESLSSMNVIGEVIAQSKSMDEKQNAADNEDVSDKMKSSEIDEQVTEHLEQHSVEANKKKFPLIDICYDLTMGVGQQSACNAISLSEDVRHVAKKDSSQTNIPENTASSYCRSCINNNEDINQILTVPSGNVFSDSSSDSICRISQEFAVLSRNERQNALSPKLITSHYVSGDLTPVQRYMAAASQFIDGARSPPDSSLLLSSPQINLLNESHNSLLHAQVTAESVNVDALFPKGKRLRRAVTSPKICHKLYSQGSEMLNVNDINDVFSPEKPSKPVNQENLSVESKNRFLNHSPDVFFGKPQLCFRSSNSRKRKLFCSSGQFHYELFRDETETQIRSCFSAFDDCDVLKPESRVDGDARILPSSKGPSCETLGFPSDNISSEAAQNEENFTKYNQRIKIYGTVIKGINQQRKECKKMTDSKRTSDGNHESSSNAKATECGNEQQSSDKRECENLTCHSEMKSADDLMTVRHFVEAKQHREELVQIPSHCKTASLVNKVFLSIDSTSQSSKRSQKSSLKHGISDAAEKLNQNDQETPLNGMELRFADNKLKIRDQDYGCVTNFEMSEDFVNRKNDKLKERSKIRSKSSISKRNSDHEGFISRKSSRNASVRRLTESKWDDDKVMTPGDLESNVAVTVSINRDDNRLTDKRKSSRSCTKRTVKTTEMPSDNTEQVLLVEKKVSVSKQTLLQKLLPCDISRKTDFESFQNGNIIGQQSSLGFLSSVKYNTCQSSKANFSNLKRTRSSNATKDSTTLSKKWLKKENDINVIGKMEKSLNCLSLMKNKTTSNDNYLQKISVKDAKTQSPNRMEPQKTLPSKPNFSPPSITCDKTLHTFTASLHSENSQLQEKSEQLNCDKQKNNLMLNGKELTMEKPRDGHWTRSRQKLECKRLNSAVVSIRRVSVASTEQLIQPYDEIIETPQTEQNANSSSSSEYEVILSDCDSDSLSKQKSKLDSRERPNLRSHGKVDAVAPTSRKSSALLKPVSDICSNSKTKKSRILQNTKRFYEMRSRQSSQKKSVSSCNIVKHSEHSRAALSNENNLSWKHDIFFASVFPKLHKSSEKTGRSVALGLNTVIAPSHKSNSSSNISFDMRTKKEKASVDSSTDITHSQELCRFGKTQSKEQTISNQLSRNNSLREFLSVEIGSTRKDKKVLLKEFKFSDKSRRAAHAYFVNFRS